mgnify:CR=1 FL=1|tara:strand:- start:609 stop:728 length:120 start_codon:yes stop_codon:yes gene_type:complete
MNEHMLYNNLIAKLTKQLEEKELEIKQLKDENRKLKNKK